MLRHLFRPLLSLLVLLIFMGSAGWLYTGHFCKMEEACEEVVSGDCCSDKGDACKVDQSAFGDDRLAQKVTSDRNESASENLYSTNDETCCFDVDFYLNFPVYKTTSFGIPEAGFLSIDFVVNTNFNSSSFQNSSFGFAGMATPTPLHEWVSLSQRLAVLSVFRV